MRRRQSPNNLDLFLDAICNMFGGFLFIMLFVVVSVRSATRERLEELQASNVKPMAKVEVEERRLQLEKLEFDFKQLSEDRQKSVDFVNNLVDPSVVERVQETFSLAEQIDRLKKENEELEQTNEDLQKEREKIVADNALLKKQLSETREKTQEAEKEAEQKREKLVRKTRPPRLRSGGTKSELPVVVKFGRVYLWHVYDQYGGRAADFNDADFVVVGKSRGAIRAEPKPWRGVDLTKDDVETELNEMFKNFDPNVYYVTIVCANDSYAEYNALVSFLKDRNFDVFPFVKPVGSIVVDRGGYDKPVQ